MANPSTYSAASGSASSPQAHQPGRAGPRRFSSILGMFGYQASISSRNTSGFSECLRTGASIIVTGCSPDAGATASPRVPTSGSVRARASKYNLCSRTDDDVLSRSFQDGQHGHAAAEELEPAAIGGNVLVMAGAEAEKVAEFVVGSAEPGG